MNVIVIGGQSGLVAFIAKSKDAGYRIKIANANNRNFLKEFPAFLDFHRAARWAEKFLRQELEELESVVAATAEESLENAV